MSRVFRVWCVDAHGCRVPGVASTVGEFLALVGMDRRVDLVLEAKRLKWAFKQAERCGASRLVLVAPEEWEKGVVRVKNLATREEADLTLDELCG
jgi:histidyl-tRNA synthetase